MMKRANPLIVKHPLALKSAHFPSVVIVHGLDHIAMACAPGLPVTLLSAPGAAGYAGCGWWLALVNLAREMRPDIKHDIKSDKGISRDIPNFLDCGDGSDLALEALRLGLRHLVLSPTAPGWACIVQTATAMGGIILDSPPPALDMADPAGAFHLSAWLRGGTQAAAQQ